MQSGNNVAYLGNNITRDIKGVENKKITKRKRGRPVGSSTGAQTVMVVRNQFEQALDILKRDHNVTLGELIANGLTESTASMNQTLATVAKFLPSSSFVDINLGATSGSFADALSAAADIMRSDKAKPVIIDIEPEKEEKERENKGLDD